MRTDRPWESTIVMGRAAQCEALPREHKFMLSITDHEMGVKVTAQLTLSQAMALRAYIGNVARQFTSQARFHSGA